MTARRAGALCAAPLVLPATEAMIWPNVSTASSILLDQKSIINGFWTLTITMGNLMVVGITKALPGTGATAHSASVTASRFMMYAGLTFVVAILFSIIRAFYRYRDPAAAMGK